MLSYSIMREVLGANGFGDYRKAGKDQTVSAVHYLSQEDGPLPARAVALVDERGVAVLDSDFKILARSEITEPLPAGTIWDCMMGETFDVAAYYDARERALIARAFEDDANREIVFRPNRDLGHDYYSALLQVNGKPVGCIGIVDVFSPLSDAQVATARIVRDMLEAYLRNNQRSLLFLRTLPVGSGSVL